MANLMSTSNPALNEKAFKGQVAYGEAMTLQGTVNKTGLLLLCVVASSSIWKSFACSARCAADKRNN
jgi:uncharacterized YccA/Bax inhibitor family protein